MGDATVGTKLKNRIVRAAVAWERKMHESVQRYEMRDTKSEEGELAAAVQAYNSQLLFDDAGEPEADRPDGV